MHGLNSAISAYDAATSTGPMAAALDFGVGGVRAAVCLRSGLTSLPLVEEGLSPASLLTFKNGDKLPEFPNLLDRLGEDCLVSFDHAKPQKPHHHLRDLFSQARSSLGTWWGPSACVALVVSAYANDRQRGLVLRSASTAGWTVTRLVNKTTALAIHALQKKPNGKYLSLVLGHGPAEASVLQWEDRKLHAISYSSEPRLSGSELDHILLQKILATLHSSNNLSLPRAYSQQDWMWLRERAEQIRRRLNYHSRIILELPAALTGTSAQEIVIEGKTWQQELAPLFDSLADFIGRCSREADVAMGKLDGFCVTGGLLMQAPLRDRLAQLCQGRMEAYGADAQLLGACELGRQEEGETKIVGAGVVEPTTEAGEDRPFRISADAGTYDSAGASAQARPVIHRVPPTDTSSSQGKTIAPRIQKLEDYIQKLEGGLEQAREIMVKLKSKAAKPSSKAAASAETEAPNPDSLKRERGHVFAQKCIARAEALLQAGRLEEAIRLSHRALQASNDSKIFRAVIEVHLRTASARPASPETFADDRRWLLCALSDDATNEEVQKALAQRFFIHAQQMLTSGTEKGRLQGVATLQEMLEDVPLAEEAEEANRLLRENAH